jgi:hypothetical protein
MTTGHIIPQPGMGISGNLGNPGRGDSTYSPLVVRQASGSLTRTASVRRHGGMVSYAGQCDIVSTKILPAFQYGISAR